jgi:hypothetical protein
MSQSLADHNTGELLSFQKGKYVFMDELQEVYHADSPVPALMARAIRITEQDGVLYGDTGLLKLSDLILKQSAYQDETGRIIEAHKLYTWPRNLGSTKEWTACKIDFINQYILNFPIEVLALQQPEGISWKYISPENFKNFPADISGTAAFMEFAAQKDDYFFLRRPINEPR